MLNSKLFSFQKNQRLLNKKDYSYVFQAAKRLSTRWFTVLYRPCLEQEHNSNPPARLGLVISKKSAKRAVDRNKIKRHIRETFRLNQYKVPKFDIVVLSKRGITDANHQEFIKELNYIWQKLSRMVS